MAQLFETLNIREVTFRNRIVMSPMCQYSSPGGYANDWHLVHLVSRAVGGAGLVMTESGWLRIYQGSKLLLQEQGAWDY